ACRACDGRSTDRAGRARGRRPHICRGQRGIGLSRLPVRPRYDCHIHGYTDVYMCGIIGVVGDEPALPVIMDGLRRVEYRGYDSAGVAVLDGARIDVVRKAGKLDALEKELASHALDGHTGIGHTRWATHGGPTD